MKHRVCCQRCGTHRDLNTQPECPCGETAVKAVPPSAADQQAVVQDVLRSAREVSGLLRLHGSVRRGQPPVETLLIVVHELVLMELGILCR